MEILSGSLTSVETNNVHGGYGVPEPELCNCVIFTYQQDQYATLSFLGIGKIASKIILYGKLTVFYGILAPS